MVQGHQRKILDQEVISENARVRPQEIADELRRRILRGDYIPGSWLRERQLAERFGVSRGPVREAFRQLAEERLLEFEPFRGARVAQLSRQEIIEMFEIRAALLCAAARIAADRATDDDIRDFSQEVKKLVSMVRIGSSPADLVMQGGAASSVLARASHAPELQAMLRAVTRKAQWHYTHIAVNALATAVEAARHWATAAKALEGRDGEQAEAAMRKALRHVQDHALAAFELSAEAK